MISEFSLDLPAHVFFGPGIRTKLFSVVKERGYGRVLLLTGSRWFRETGWQATFEKQLTNCQCLFQPCAPGEPDLASVNNILEVIREWKPELIVGIGGGSVIDTAKACGALAGQELPVEDYLEGIGKGLELKKPGLPVIAMPTTAGTGAEATRNAVIKSAGHHVKKSIRSPYLIPEFVIVDPELALDLDPLLTGMAGMDALVQLFEAYVSRKARPIPRSLIRPAFPLLLQALETLAAGKRSLEARTDAAYGALISGIALANSGLGAVHGFASALGGMTEIPHGLICAVFFVPVLNANTPDILKRSRELLDGPEQPEELLDKFKHKVERLIVQFKLDEALSRYCLPRERVPEAARLSAGSSMSGNPRELSGEEKEEIIIRALQPILTA